MSNRWSWFSLWHAIRWLVLRVFRVSFDRERKYAAPIHLFSSNFLRSVLSKYFIEGLGARNPAFSFLALLPGITVTYFCLFGEVCVCLAWEGPRKSGWFLALYFSHMRFLEKISVVCQHPGEGVHGVNGLSLLWSFKTERLVEYNLHDFWAY